MQYYRGPTSMVSTELIPRVDVPPLFYELPDGDRIAEKASKSLSAIRRELSSLRLVE